MLIALPILTSYTLYHTPMDSSQSLTITESREGNGGRSEEESGAGEEEEELILRGRPIIEKRAVVEESVFNSNLARRSFPKPQTPQKRMPFSRMATVISTCMATL
jgi:hypothetical protein